MACKPRIHFPGAVYHVILRGNGGQDIFYSEEDRFRLYLLLQEGIERFGHRIHAFCLMTNHIHMAIQVRDIALSKIIQGNGVKSALDPCCLIGQGPRGYRSLRIRKKTEKH